MPNFIGFLCSTYISHTLFHVFSVNWMWWKLSLHIWDCMWHCQIHGAVFSKVFQEKHLLKACNYSWGQLRITGSIESTEKKKKTKKLELLNSLLSYCQKQRYLYLVNLKFSVCLDFCFCRCVCSLLLSHQNLIWIPHWGGGT